MNAAGYSGSSKYWNASLAPESFRGCIFATSCLQQQKSARPVCPSSKLALGSQIELRSLSHYGTRLERTHVWWARGSAMYSSIDINMFHEHCFQAPMLRSPHTSTKTFAGHKLNCSTAPPPEDPPSSGTRARVHPGNASFPSHTGWGHEGCFLQVLSTE